MEAYPASRFPLFRLGILADLYRSVRVHSEIHGDGSAWDEKASCDGPIRCIHDPAQWVLDGRISYFHHCVARFRPAIRELPVLGLCLFATSMKIDWSMAGWQAQQVDEFISWLVAVADSQPSLNLELDEEVPPDWTAAFRRDFELLRASGA
jgi:hypothetical protein